MSVAEIAPGVKRVGSGGVSPRGFGNAVLAICVFLGGFVLFEPAPYEIVLVPVIVVWVLCGLKFPRTIAPLMVLLLLFEAGGLIATTQVADWSDAPLYIAVSIFLALTAIFLAAIVAASEQRLRLITNTYIASALVVALLGILGYFNAFPGAEIFTRYARARGPFQDPNVFGPFLVFPAIWLVRSILTKPLSRSGWQFALLGIITLGIFLSFSRAAWGLFALCGVMIGFLVFVNERSAADRLRLIGLAGLGIAALTAVVLIALSTDQVSELFAERARLVQDYDGAKFGRFDRHWLGFQLAMEYPLGLGALEFSSHLKEDPHNIYLKSLVAYGWLGGISLLALMIWTYARAFPILFKPRPWTPYLQCAYVVLAGHSLIGIVIDVDHWRHFYLLLGLIWGIIALDARHSRRHSQMSKIQAGG